MNTSLEDDKRFTLKTEVQPNGDRKLALAGHLGLQEVETFETQIQADWPPTTPSRTSLDLSGLEFIDSAGAVAILELSEKIKAQGGSCSLENVPAKIQGIIDLIDIKALTQAPLIGGGEKTDFVSQVGDGFLEFVQDMNKVISFTGEIIIDLAATCFNPRLVRWSDVIFYMKRVGVEGLPIISLIALLLGLILAFMSSLQLKQFGANIYVASLLAISMVRN